MRRLLESALLLAAFTLAATGLVAATHALTAERVAQAERAVLLDRLHALIPPDRYDNDLFSDRMEVTDPMLLGTPAPVEVWRARRAGRPVALVLEAVAPDGYSGEIRLLVAVNHDGTVAGVRVISHRETPGLGDKIEAERSDWITRFNGHSLENTADAQWHVKKDGGAFDQFAGATVTPRAVVRAVADTLQYVQRHSDQLYAAPAPPGGAP
jgi:electron transport complex protein RnfG